MLHEFLRDTMHVPPWIEVHLTAFFGTLYNLALSPRGILVALIFVMAGYVRIGKAWVLVLAVAGGFILVHFDWDGWLASGLSRDMRNYRMAMLIAAAVVLSLAGAFVGSKLSRGND